MPSRRHRPIDPTATIVWNLDIDKSDRDFSGNRDKLLFSYYGCDRFFPLRRLSGFEDQSAVWMVERLLSSLAMRCQGARHVFCRRRGNARARGLHRTVCPSPSHRRCAFGGRRDIVATLPGTREHRCPAPLSLCLLWAWRCQECVRLTAAGYSETGNLSTGINELRDQGVDGGIGGKERVEVDHRPISA